MRKVFLFGGINSKLKHYKHAVDVYKAYKFDIEFIKSQYNGISTFIPGIYRKQIENLEKTNDKTIIHTSSGGFWAGLEFNNIKKADSFIIENGPILATPNQFINSTQKIYSIKYHPLMVNNMPKIMNYIGIPTPQYMPDFYKNIDLISKDIQNCLIMNGVNDNVVNHEHIKEYIRFLEKHTKHVESIEFKDGTHTRVYKNEIKLYQDSIENKIKSIM